MKLLLLISLIAKSQTLVNSIQISNWQQINLLNILSKDQCINFIQGNIKKTISCNFSKYSLNTGTAINQIQIRDQINVQAEFSVRGNYCLEAYSLNPVIIGCLYFPFSTTNPNLIITIWRLP